MEVFYGLKDQETLDHEIQGVIERNFDSSEPGEWPDFVEVLTFRHKQINVNAVAEAVLEHLLEMLWEDYGNYEASPDPPTWTLRAAARAFVRLAGKGFPLYQCDETGDSEMVSVREYLGAE